jgi:hypothetical protein
MDATPFLAEAETLRASLRDGRLDVCFCLLADQNATHLAEMEPAERDGFLDRHPSWHGRHWVGGAVWALPAGAFKALAHVGSYMDFLSDDDADEATRDALRPYGLWRSGAGFSANLFDAASNDWPLRIWRALGDVSQERSAKDPAPLDASGLLNGALAWARGARQQVLADLAKCGVPEPLARLGAGGVAPLDAATAAALCRQDNPYGGRSLPADERERVLRAVAVARAHLEAQAIGEAIACQARPNASRNAPRV